MTRLWCRTKDIDFETKFLFGMYQVLLGHFEGLGFDTDQRFFILKSTFSLILCQVLQVCLLFLGRDLFFMVNRLWYRLKDIDFKLKLIMVRVGMVTLAASLWYRSRDFDFEINFVYKFVPSAWSFIIISVVRHVPVGNLPLIQATAFDFEIKFLNGFVPNHWRSLIFARGRYRYFGG